MNFNNLKKFVKLRYLTKESELNLAQKNWLRLNKPELKINKKYVAIAGICLCLLNVGAISRPNDPSILEPEEVVEPIEEEEKEEITEEVILISEETAEIESAKTLEFINDSKEIMIDVVECLSEIDEEIENSSIEVIEEKANKLSSIRNDVEEYDDTLYEVSSDDSSTTIVVTPVTQTVEVLGVAEELPNCDVIYCDNIVLQ